MVNTVFRYTKTIDFKGLSKYIYYMTTFIHKNSLAKIINNRVVQHFCFWGFFFLVFLYISFFQKTFILALLYNLCVIIFLSIPVYLNFYLLHNLFNNKRYYLYSFCLLVVILFSGILQNIFFKNVFKDQYDVYYDWLTISLVIGLSTAIKFAKIVFQQKLEFQEIKAKQLQTELDLLKAQINPHFLFNTLNNLFGLSRKQDRRTADGIAQLSHLMRYMIYDSKVEQIELKKEVEQVKRLIELQKLRFLKEDKIEIDFRIEGDVSVIKIPPMLLIPFVENSFKHGISLSKKSFIKLNLQVNEQYLHFQIMNTIHRKKDKNKKTKPGLGLENVKRRLKLLYPEGYKLAIQDNKQIFEVDLRIKI